MKAAAERFGRLVRPADFERVLQTRSRATSPHFALHHVAGAPTLPRRRKPLSRDLSTDGAPSMPSPVDDSRLPGPVVLHAGVAADPAREAPQPVSGHWLGVVVPKRHARRAVTRSLLKRQIRAAAERHAGALPPGLWVVRLRAGFDRSEFPSAASAPLRHAARCELDSVFDRAATRGAAR